MRDDLPPASPSRSSGALADDGGLRSAPPPRPRLEDGQAFHPTYLPVGKFIGEDPAPAWPFVRVVARPSDDLITLRSTQPTVFGWVGDEAQRFIPPRKFVEDPQAFHPTYFPLRAFVGLDEARQASAVRRLPDEASIGASSRAGALVSDEVGRTWVRRTATTDDAQTYTTARLSFAPTDDVRATWRYAPPPKFTDDPQAFHPTYFPLRSSVVGDEPQARAATRGASSDDQQPGGTTAKSSGWVADGPRAFPVAPRQADDPLAFRPVSPPLRSFVGIDEPRAQPAQRRPDDVSAPGAATARSAGWVAEDGRPWVSVRRLSDAPQTFRPTYLPLRSFLGAEDARAPAASRTSLDDTAPGSASRARALVGDDGARSWTASRRQDDATLPGYAVRSFGWIATEDRPRPVWIGVRADDAPAPHPTYFPLRTFVGDETAGPTQARRQAYDDSTALTSARASALFDDAARPRTIAPTTSQDAFLSARVTSALQKTGWYTDDKPPAAVYRRTAEDWLPFSTTRPYQSPGWFNEHRFVSTVRRTATDDSTIGAKAPTSIGWAVGEAAAQRQARPLRADDAVPSYLRLFSIGALGDGVAQVRLAAVRVSEDWAPGKTATASAGWLGGEAPAQARVATRYASTASDDASVQPNKRSFPLGFASDEVPRLRIVRRPQDEAWPFSRSPASVGWYAEAAPPARAYGAARDDAPAPSTARASAGWVSFEPQRQTRRIAAADDNPTQRAKAASVGFASDDAVRAAVRPASPDDSAPPTTKPQAKSSIGWADAYQLRARIIWGYTDGGELFANLAFRIRLAFVAATDASNFITAASVSDIVTAADGSNFVAGASTPDIVTTADGTLVLVPQVATDVVATTSAADIIVATDGLSVLAAQPSADDSNVVAASSDIVTTADGSPVLVPKPGQ